jgi:hypothetical protein
MTMATPKKTRKEVIDEFVGYVVNICDTARSPEDRTIKLLDTLNRLWDTGVRISVNSLTPEDADLTKWSNAELAEALRIHTFRQGGIRNGIFDKILEAADRLSPEPHA